MRESSINLVEFSLEEFSSIIKEAVAFELNKINALISSKPNKLDDELLTREEVKNLLKTSYTSLWKWDNEGVLKCKRIGKKVFYLKSDVMNKLKEE